MKMYFFFGLLDDNEIMANKENHMFAAYKHWHSRWQYAPLKLVWDPLIMKKTSNHVVRWLLHLDRAQVQTAEYLYSGLFFFNVLLILMTWNIVECCIFLLVLCWWLRVNDHMLMELELAGRGETGCCAKP